MSQIFSKLRQRGANCRHQIFSAFLFTIIVFYVSFYLLLVFNFLSHFSLEFIRKKENHSQKYALVILDSSSLLFN